MNLTKYVVILYTILPNSTRKRNFDLQKRSAHVLTQNYSKYFEANIIRDYTFQFISLSEILKLLLHFYVFIRYHNVFYNF